jgi:hypothetical protein
MRQRVRLLLLLRDAGDDEGWRTCNSKQERDDDDLLFPLWPPSKMLTRVTGKMTELNSEQSNRYQNKLLYSVHNDSASGEGPRTTLPSGSANSTRDQQPYLSQPQPTRQRPRKGQVTTLPGFDGTCRSAIGSVSWNRRCCCAVPGRRTVPICRRRRRDPHLLPSRAPARTSSQENDHLVFRSLEDPFSFEDNDEGKVVGFTSTICTMKVLLYLQSLTIRRHSNASFSNLPLGNKGTRN